MHLRPTPWHAHMRRSDEGDVHREYCPNTGISLRRYPCQLGGKRRPWIFLEPLYGSGSDSHSSTGGGRILLRKLRRQTGLTPEYRRTARTARLSELVITKSQTLTF